MKEKFSKGKAQRMQRPPKGGRERGAIQVGFKVTRVAEAYKAQMSLTGCHNPRGNNSCGKGVLFLNEIFVSRLPQCRVARVCVVFRSVGPSQHWLYMAHDPCAQLPHFLTKV